MNWVDFIIGCCAGALFGIAFCVALEKMQERDIDRAVRKDNGNDDSIIIPLTRCKKCGEVIVKVDNPFYANTCYCSSVEKEMEQLKAIRDDELNCR